MKKFNEIWFEATDETIRRVLGNTASELIYTLIDRHVSLKREEIVDRIEDFHAYLGKLLGSEQAQIIRAVSIRCLCLKLEREYAEVERLFSALDELYEIKFKLLVSPSRREGTVCS